MIRIGLGRGPVAVVALALCLFGVGVRDAFATHFRYGNIYWERVLTHNVAGEAKYRVTFEGGWRWSFPWGNIVGAACPPAPFVASNSTGTGSCPPLGALLNVGSITASRAVKFNGAATTATAITYNAKVTAINTNKDLVYTSFSFDVIVPSTAATTFVFTSNGRLSQVLDGNNDTTWRLAVTLDPTGPATKSPKSVSIPSLTVTQGVDNTIDIPTLAFDNLTNRIRLATTAESSLPTIQPAAPSQFALDSTGLTRLHFTPRVTAPTNNAALYAVQFIIESVDTTVTPPAVRAAVPVELLFEAIPPTTTFASLTTPNLDVFFPFNVDSGFTVSATLSGAGSVPLSNWVGTINATPVPVSGVASYNVPAAANAAGPVTGTVVWRPDLTSSPTTMCFQAVFRNVTTNVQVVSPGMLCVDMNLNALPTTLSQLTVPAAATVGDSMPISVKATRTIDGAVIVGRQVVFELLGPDGTVTSTATATTNILGLASTTIPVVVAGNNVVRATLLAVAGQYLESQALSSTITVPGQGALDAPVLPSLASVGIPSPITVKLKAMPGGNGAPNALVTFDIDGPDGPSTLTATTNSSGIATALYTPRSAASGFTVVARFAGTVNVIGPVDSATTSFSTYQRVQLTLSPIAGVANTAAPVSATLLKYPQGDPVVGKTVSFSFTGGPVVQTAITDASGVAATSVTYAATGTYSATASFPVIAPLINAVGATTPETSTTTVNIGTANSSLLPVTVTSPALVGSGLTLSTTLTRTTAPAGPIATVPVVFTLRTPAGVTSTLTGTTNGSGVATVTFPAPASRGLYTVSAAFAGGGGINASQSGASSAPVYQRTQLSMLPIAGLAGAPLVLSANLVTTPAPSSPLVGASVTFDFGGVIPSQTVTTNTAGTASTTVNFPAGGAFPVTASFLDAGAFYADDTGAFPVVAETASTTATMSKAATSLSALSVSGTAVPGGSLTVSTVLNRIVSPTGPVTGSTVTFTAVGASTRTFTATTAGNGLASVTIPLTERGPLAITAAFAGTGALSASSSNTATQTIVQPVKLTLNPVTTTAGDTAVVSAALTAVGSNAPIEGQPVTFDFNNVIPSTTAITSAAGIASVTVSFPSSGTFPATASFQNLADFFRDENGQPVPSTATTTATVAAAVSSLSPIVVSPTAFVSDSLTVSTTLTRVSTPAGPVAGATVSFALSGASSQTLNATTDQNGVATATFPLSARGGHAVAASWAGTSGLAGAASAPANVVVYQRTQLQVASASGVAGAPVTMTATLTTSPAGQPIAGQTVAFSVAGGATLYQGSAVTNASGIASVDVVVAGGGSFTGTASFQNTADHFADRTGALDAETSTASVTIANAATALAPLSVAPNALVGDSLPVSTSLSRTSAPAGALTGATVTFTLTDAEGTQTVDAVTGSTGIASASFPLAARGAYVVRASFAGSEGLEPAAPRTADVTVYQKAQLALASLAGPAGSTTRFSATLQALPGGGPIEGQTIAFSFGGAIPAATAVTGATGVATIDVTFPTAGTFTATASFLHVLDRFVNRDGQPAVEAASASVTVADSTPPSIAATVTGAQGADDWYVGAVTISWSVADGESDVTSQTGCDTMSVATEGDALTFTCTATSGGGSSSKSVTIKRDVTKPILTVPAAQTIEATGAAGANAMYPAATATDPTSGAGPVTCSPAVGSALPFGPTTVTCSVADAAGNDATASFVATVVDTTAPVVEPHADVTTSATSSSGAIVTFTAPASHDVVDGDAASTCTPASGSTFALGAHTVTCSKTDAHGNTGSVTFTVSVTNNAPTFTPPTPITREATGSNGAVVTFSANGSDVEQGTIAASCSPASGSTFAVGTTTVSCTVTDVANATASGSFTVTVRDTTAPVVTAASVTFEQTSPAGAVATFASSASDIVDGAVATTCSPASGTTFARGTTTVTCSATDAHGNSASTTATVTVRDTIKPVVTYSGQAAAYDVSQTIAIACAATDSGSGVASTTCANVNTSASSYTVGLHTLSATATDVAGNVGQASVSFTVTVSASSLQALITQIIGDSSVAGPLNTKLAQAATAPNANAKAGHLHAFENQVNAQSGKKLTAAQAALLLQLVQSLY